MKEKYITDDGFGASKKDAVRGYTNETIPDEKDSWEHEYEEKRKWREMGFGREQGEAR